MKEYKTLIKEMYDAINDFVQSHPAIEKEVFERQKDFIRLSFTDQNIGRLFFDWFIFDYQLEKYHKRLFDVFLDEEKGKSSQKLYEIYFRLGLDCFGIYKIKAVKLGKEFVCENVISSKEYHVFDTRGSRVVEKGGHVIGRLLPFDRAFIAASDVLFFSRQDYDVIGLLLKNAPESHDRQDAFEIYKMLFPERIPEQLSVEEKFTLLCKEGGLSDDDVEDVFLEMRMAIKDKKASADIMQSVLNRMMIPKWVSAEEFGESFVVVWNQFVGEIHQGTEKGPMEKTLVRACTSAMEKKFLQPTGIMSSQEQKVFVEKVQRWSDEWFITPLKEMNGKTPKEVIMEERKAMGNPQEEFGYDFQMNKIYIDMNEQKAEQLFDDAARCMKEGQYQKALELYQDYVQLWDGNHVVWHNMGVCCVFLLQKRKAEKCFERALMLYPDYDLAHEKWKQLKSMYKEDMVQMVKHLKKRKKV